MILQDKTRNRKIWVLLNHRKITCQCYLLQILMCLFLSLPKYAFIWCNITKIASLEVIKCSYKYNMEPYRNSSQGWLIVEDNICISKCHCWMLVYMTKNIFNPGNHPWSKKDTFKYQYVSTVDCSEKSFFRFRNLLWWD